MFIDDDDNTSQIPANEQVSMIEFEQPSDRDQQDQHQSTESDQSQEHDSTPHQNLFYEESFRPPYESLIPQHEDQFQTPLNYNTSQEEQLNQSQRSKKAGNKLSQIKGRTNSILLISYQVDQFSWWFVGIDFPIGRNIFETFYLFKQQLNNQLFNYCQCCYYKDYLVEISLTLTKYHLIIQQFQEEVVPTDQIKPIDFLKDLLIILNKYENEYADLLVTVREFMRGQEIDNIHQDFRRWQKLAKLFKKQLFINKSFYKSHNCNYRNFIVQKKQRRYKMDQEWFYMRDNQIIEGQRHVPQSKAGKKNFVRLMNREQMKYLYGLNSNIGYFTLIVLFNQVNQNEKANSLIYADDIFNVIIKYNIIL